MSQKWWKVAGPYLLAIGSVIAATMLTIATPSLRESHSLLFFLTAVIVTASFGGLGPSLAAIMLSAICYIYWIIPPLYTWAVTDAEDRNRLAAFVFVAILVSSLHSARQRAERSVRSLDQRLKFAMEATKIGVWDLDLQTGAMWHSPALEEIYGRNSKNFAQGYEVMIGYIHPDDREAIHRKITRSMDTGEDFQAEHRIVLPDGSLRWVAARGRVFQSDSKKPERLVAIITESSGGRLHRQLAEPMA